MGTSFSPELYEVIREGARRSAEVVVPLFLKHYQPQSVIDVGCGEGMFAIEFAARGCEVLGIDEAPLERPFNFQTADLSQPLDLGRTFDLAVCLEVAEHLPPESADTLIESLCNLAPVVLFSAAIPGQGGIGHRNEQWPAYWVERFEAQGFKCSGALRWAIWDDDRIENWYRQNLIVAVTEGYGLSLPALFDTPLAPVWPVVHPVLYDARRR